MFEGGFPSDPWLPAFGGPSLRSGDTSLGVNFLEPQFVMLNLQSTARLTLGARCSRFRQLGCSAATRRERPALLTRNVQLPGCRDVRARGTLLPVCASPPQTLRREPLPVNPRGRRRPGEIPAFL